MSEDLPAVPQRMARIETVAFDGDDLLAVVLDGEGVAVPVRTLCLAIGLDVSNQVDRLREHDVLARGLRMVKVPLEGRVRSVVAILHDYIPFWLGTITPSQVRDEVREKLVRYQLELKDLLAAVYGTTTPLADTADVQALQRQLRATLHELRVLREQFLSTTQQLGEQVNAHDLRMTMIEGLLDERLGAIARQVADQQMLLDEYIAVTPAQQQHIKGTIQRLAKRHQQRTGQETYAKLFGDFCWELNVPRYDALPASRYADALAWLRRKASELGYPELVQEQQEGMF
jgi:P22_AR N-terminal domain